MQILEYRLPKMDKMVAWGPGPWVDKPDKIQWPDKVTGLPCLVVRNHSGAWCGYVGVSEEHPHFGRVFETVSVTVHGGLRVLRLLPATRTRSGRRFRLSCCGGGRKRSGVVARVRLCSRLGRSARAWRSLLKGNLFNTPELLGRVYRAVDYAREECRKLALQVQSANDLRNGWQDGRA